MKLVRKTEITKPEVVYTLGIKDDHNYVVEGAVVENCHRVKGNSLRTLLSGIFKDVPIRWGVTGTLPEQEMDRVALLCCVGPEIGRIDTLELQDLGILSNLDIKIWQLKDVGEAFKNYSSELRWLTTSKPRIEFLAKKFEELGATGNTLILVDRIETGNMLQSLIPNSVFVDGSMKSKDRKNEYKEVASVDGKIIIGTYGCISTGVNIPRVFNLVLFEAGKSFVRVIQSIGRGLRVAEDKDFVNVIDVCSTSKFSKRHLSKRKAHYAQAGYPFSVNKLDY